MRKFKLSGLSHVVGRDLLRKKISGNISMWQDSYCTVRNIAGYWYTFLSDRKVLEDKLPLFHETKLVNMLPIWYCSYPYSDSTTHLTASYS